MSQGTRDATRARLERELCLLLLGLVVLFSLSAIVDPDLPGHVRYGLDHLAEGRLPLHDPYSYSVAPGDVWINHEWLFELAAGWLFAHAGAAGLVALQALAWGTTGALVLLLLRRASQDFVPGAVVYLLFAAAAFAAITIRPQLCSFLFASVLLALLELARGGRLGALLGLPPLFLLWVNAHGGFVAGLCILGAYAGGLVLDAALRRDARGDLEAAPARPWRLAGLTAGAAGLAAALPLLNPYGTGLYRWLSGSLGRTRSEQITEWRSIELDAQGLLFVLLVLLVLVALAARDRRRTPLCHALVLAGTAALALRHARHAPFFAIAAAAFAPGAVSDLYRRWVEAPTEDLEPGTLRRVRLLYGVVLLPALLINLTMPHRDFLDLALRPRGNSPFPTGAYRYMEEADVRGNLLVYFDWAQLVIWRFHPDVRVFYDGRFRTVYRPEVEEAFFDFIARSEQPGWRRALDAWPTEWVLMPAEHPASARVAGLPEFRLVYRDPTAMLFRRRRPGEPDAPPVEGPFEPPVIPFRPRPR